MKIVNQIAIALLSVAALSQCGPAGEDRNLMHSRAKQVQDSIANSIRQAIAEAEEPANTAVRVDTPQKPAPSPSATGK